MLDLFISVRFVTTVISQLGDRIFFYSAVDLKNGVSGVSGAYTADASKALQTCPCYHIVTIRRLYG